MQVILHMAPLCYIVRSFYIELSQMKTLLCILRCTIDIYLKNVIDSKGGGMGFKSMMKYIHVQVIS